MKTFMVLLSIYVLTWADAAQAGEAMTTGTLLSYCNSPDRTVKRECFLYILGVTEGMVLAKAMIKENQHQACIPDNIEGGQLVVVFQQLAGNLQKAYPDDMKLNAAGVVGAAMVRTFPCAK